MKLAKNGEFSMNRQEVVEFTLWLSNNPRERYKRFNDVVYGYIAFKNNDEWVLDEAQ
jgi:hypothetical protein